MYRLVYQLLNFLIHIFVAAILLPITLWVSEPELAIVVGSATVAVAAPTIASTFTLANTPIVGRGVAPLLLELVGLASVCGSAALRLLITTPPLSFRHPRLACCHCVVPCSMVTRMTSR